MTADPITVSVPVMSKADAKFAPPYVVERSEWPEMSSRRSDAETRERVAERAARLREQGPYMRVVVRP